MRKFLGKLVIAVVFIGVLSILWVNSGRQLSLVVDRFRTIQITSVPITTLRYQGSGKGGVLIINDLHLELAPANEKIAPADVGTTKDNQLALSFGGKVFAFGPVDVAPDEANENLATKPQSGDKASLAVRRSALPWVEPFKLNFMTGRSPTWRRHAYYQIDWKKASGPRLEILWRYEQYFYPATGWTSGFMTRENSTGLVYIGMQSSSKNEQ